MEMSKSKFDELLERHSMTELDAENAFDFVHVVLALEADITEKKEPSAFNTIKRLNNAAYAVFEIGSDVSGDFFGED